jgi:O-acetyl-ADP-ribose deacetylase (regulator of RNase III)
MPYSIVNGNLLDATADYIVQQCCCTALKPSGLSKAIADKWPEANPYKNRRRYKYNWAVAEDRPQPGTIATYGRVVCAFAQVCQGKPGAYKDPLGLDQNDSAANRADYFAKCLEAILDLKPASVAFPYKIGCGLAGGSWHIYEDIIKKWSDKNPSIQVTLYKLE